MWFRNETTLLVLWQPPYPSGVFDKYKVRSSLRIPQYRPRRCPQSSNKKLLNSLMHQCIRKNFDHRSFSRRRLCPQILNAVIVDPQVSIHPQDSPQSVLFVEKDNDPPGPAQAAFYGLVPGRAYNISVQTVSRDVVSQPTDAQYRTGEELESSG